MPEQLRHYPSAFGDYIASLMIEMPSETVLELYSHSMGSSW